MICDLITAVLLFGQFNFLRSRALFVLASGYLFTAFIAFAHALTFPGVFSPTGWLGAGAQTTAWLYMFWHGGFPLFVIAYALLKEEGSEGIGTSGTIGLPHGGVGLAILAGVVAVLALVAGLTLVATVGERPLPVLVQDGRFNPGAVLGCLGVLAVEPPGAGYSVASRAAQCARSVVDGRHVRMALRHRAVGRL